jgi:DNA-binding PadR family transcriptional regulator
MDDESQELVDEQAYSWLEMHKKSALSFLVLCALERQEMWSLDLARWITDKTGWTITEKGIYRVLRRMQKQGSIRFTTKPAARTGAERKVYRITPEGSALLSAIRQELSYIDKV